MKNEDGQTDGQTDRQTDRAITIGHPQKNLRGPNNNNNNNNNNIIEE